MGEVALRIMVDPPFLLPAPSAPCPAMGAEMGLLPGC